MYEIIYYETNKGEVPVSDFLDKQSSKAQTKIIKHVSLLAKEGQNLRRPYADYLRDGIYELRVKFSPHEYRMLYFFFQRADIVITNGFAKKTDQVPESELLKALKYKFDYERRNKNEQKLLQNQ